MKEDKANQVTGQEKKEEEQAKGGVSQGKGYSRPATRLSNNKTKATNQGQSKQVKLTKQVFGPSKQVGG